MEELKKISILISFFCLWITSFIGPAHEIILSFTLILSFGILHGSNDIILISRIRESRTSASYWLVLLFYILFVLTACVLFYYFPIIALSVFILGSAYHFGEQHWESDGLKVKRLWKRIFYLFYGMLVLSLLLWLNSRNVTEIVFSLSGTIIASWIMTYLFYTTLALLALIWLFIGLKDVGFRKKSLEELSYLLVLAVIFKISSLMWGFAIYFIFWHSLPSLYDQINFLHEKVNRKSVLAYLKSSFPFWLISVAGIMLLYYLFRDQDIFYALFFAFLAAVTFPHSLAIHEMFKRNPPEGDV